MELVQNIRIQKAKYTALQDVDFNSLEFGKYVCDHMFRCSFRDGSWQQAQIQPFQNLSLSPLTLALHYGQSIFEGMKAFRMKDGRINIFRLEKHHARLNESLRRMCMPAVPLDLFTIALEELVKIDRNWIPEAEGAALYLRPLIFASEARFGVKVAEEYEFLIVAGPVPQLYPRPISVKVEQKFIRAANGGTGYAKCAGNYGGAFYPTQLARQEGFDQVIWTDAMEHEYFEESGTMNLMFVIDGALITPPLSDSILDGITRDSLLILAKELGISVEERPIGIGEVVNAFSKGTITEAFGAGTAAIVAPIASMGIGDEVYELPAYNEKNLVFVLKRELEAIRYGKKEDRRNWNHIIS
ncbi:MAG TPA: branched-chain amino acid aminotransferase [Flavisolibacter sp.]|nr:branched-chain amino acid aminotransferase [Flavisolibacter sp.]